MQPKNDFDSRVDALLAQMTLEEKIAQLDDHAPAIERLGVPRFKYGAEALHGLCNTGRATSFPMPIGLAATFDTDLLRQIGSASGDEMRAKHHAPEWSRSRLVSLLVFSPVINILRDPRWGRAQETFGEDPCLTGALGAAFVRGIQGEHPRYLKLAACAKHLAVASGPEHGRTKFNAVVSRKDLMETYLPAFAELVEAGARTVMSTYNRVNGEHCCAHPLLIEEFLRRRLGFDGVVLSDGGALGSLHRKPEQPDRHNLTADVVETAALCLAAGCDLELGRHAYRFAGDALTRGLLTEAQIDRAVRRILRLRFELGVFDPSEENPYARTPLSVIQCEPHLALAREAARKSIVLLKNEAGALPLAAERDHTVLVAGPLAVDLQILLGNFYKGASGRLVSLLEGITGEAPEGVTITHSQGCFLNHPNHFESDWFLGLSDWATTVVACVGYSPLMEGEQGECIGAPLGGDKDTIALPDNQLRFLRRLRERLDTKRLGQRLIVVVAGGAPMELEEVHALADALVLVWYPGQEGGTALGRILWGKDAPGGRLPASFPVRLADLPAYEDYAMRGRTYRYAQKPLFYPFGYGLDYGESHAELAGLSTVGEQVLARVRLSGEREQVVQLYARWPEHPEAPTCALVGFVRVAAGQAEVSLSVPSRKLRPIAQNGEPVAGSVRVELAVAPCAPVPAVHTTAGHHPLRWTPLTCP